MSHSCFTHPGHYTDFHYIQPGHHHELLFYTPWPSSPTLVSHTLAIMPDFHYIQPGHHHELLFYTSWPPSPTLVSYILATISHSCFISHAHYARLLLYTARPPSPTLVSHTLTIRTSKSFPVIYYMSLTIYTLATISNSYYKVYTSWPLSITLIIHLVTHSYCIHPGQASHLLLLPYKP